MLHKKFMQGITESQIRHKVTPLYQLAQTELLAERLKKSDGRELFEMIMNQPKLDQALRLILTIQKFFSNIKEGAQDIVNDIMAVS